MLISYVRDRIDAMRAARPAAHDTRQHQPEAAPGAVCVDGLKRVVGTGRPVSAVLAGEGFERGAVEVDGGFEECGA